jgi:hypothetical protein
MSAAGIAYETAKARLERQQSRMSEIRTNAGLLVAATSLIGTIGNSSIREGTRLHWTAIVALVCLLTGVLTGVRPLWPLRDTHARTWLDGVAGGRLANAIASKLVWSVDVGTGRAIEIRDAHPDETAMYDALAHEMVDLAAVNRTLIIRRSRWLMASTLLLLVQVAMWGAYLAFVRG